MRCFLLISISAMGIAWCPTGWSQTSKTGPSFHCDGNLTEVEQTICNNNSLAKLDVKLFSLYKASGDAGDQIDQYNIKADQRNWMKKRDLSCGKDFIDEQEREDCIELHYLRRIVELWNIVPNVVQTEPETIAKVSEQKNTPDIVNEPKLNSSSDDRQSLAKKIMREGYLAIEGNQQDIGDPKTAKLAHQALETALACAKRLNNAPTTKRKVCRNYDQDSLPIGIEFSDGDKLCASVAVQGTGLPKTIVTSDSQIGYVTFKNSAVAITYPARSSDREFFYNFQRDRGHSILGGVMRTEFTYCEDDK